MPLSPEMAAEELAVTSSHLLPVSTTIVLLGLEYVLPSPNTCTHTPTPTPTHHIHTHTPTYPYTLTQEVETLHPDLPLIFDELVHVDHI